MSRALLGRWRVTRWRLAHCLAAQCLALCLVACGTTPAEPHACPSGTVADEAHAVRVRARLQSIPRGRALVRATERRVAAMCFAPEGSASVVDDAHEIILAIDLEDGEAAARYGHLLVHLRDGLPDEDLAGSDCDAAVARAIDREAVAYVEEIVLQSLLHATPRRYGFELSADVLGARPRERTDIARAYLLAHPDGAPGIEGLASAYRARCVDSL